MPEFDEQFRRAVSGVNRSRLNDNGVQNVLNRYNRRSFVLDVDYDGTYMFYISTRGVKYELNPPSIPTDMYARMSIELARKLVYTQSLNPIFDVPAIEHRNIGLDDINFIKGLFVKR